MKAPQSLRFRYCLCGLVFAGLAIATTTAASQTCPSSSTPALNGKTWLDTGTKDVYVDPNLPTAIQASIRQASVDFASQTGESLNVLPAGSADPGDGALDAVRVLNNPAGSPNNFSHWDSTVLWANGAATNEEITATISINPGAVLSGSTPFYDPNQPNASQFVYDETLHELGHAYGLADANVPTDPTGAPDYALQPAGASIMNGSVNTNDQGPHLDSDGNVSAGGVGATSVQSCDRQQIVSANPPSVAPTPGSGGPKTKLQDPGTGAGSGGGSCVYYDYDEWNDDTNTLTNYSGVIC